MMMSSHLAFKGESHSGLEHLILRPNIHHFNRLALIPFEDGSAGKKLTYVAL